MVTLLTEFSHDVEADIVHVTLTGVLDLSATPSVRTTLLKVLAECPVAIVVDLRAVEVATPLALTVFPASMRHRDLLPDVVLVLCVGPTTLEADLAETCIERLPVVPSVPDAVAVIRGAAQSFRRQSLTLPASLDSPQQARDSVRAACAAWGVEHIAEEARLVVSELVTNAVEHAGSTIDFEILLRAPFLHIRVRDASPAQPRIQHHDGPAAARGRGLRLVDLYSSGWGFMPLPRGKVVWATLRTHPVGARPPARPR